MALVNPADILYATSDDGRTYLYIRMTAVFPPTSPSPMWKNG